MEKPNYNKAIEARKNLGHILGSRNIASPQTEFPLTPETTPVYNQAIVARRHLGEMLRQPGVLRVVYR